MNRPILPPTYFLAALVIMVGLHLALPIVRVDLGIWNYLGVLFVIGGAALAVMANRLFDRHQTTVKPFEEPTALVITGPFRYTRNPMYLGMLWMLIGVAITLGSLSPLVVLPLFMWVINRRFVGPEEQALAARFGEAYDEYRGRVRRWM